MLKNIKKSLKGDILGGLTSGIIAIPLALAFGVASGVGAMAGLYGAIIVCFLAALFGGAKTQISGPTAPMTIIVTAAMATLATQGIVHPSYIFAIIILAGIFQVVLGFSKVAGTVKYVPYPIISGFMSGIGVIIIIIQANAILGSRVIGSPLKTLVGFGDTIANFNLHSFIIGLVTLAIVFLTPRSVNRKVPSSLIALIFCTILSVQLGFNVEIIGDIKTTLPGLISFDFDWSQFAQFIPLALSLAIIGAVDSLLTALIIDSVTKTKHDPNKVLIGQGIGNAVSGLFGGLIGAGATMRTVVNIKAGGETRVSAIIHSLFLAAILLGAAPLVKNIPMAVLAGILIKVAWDLIDVKFLSVIKYAPKNDLYVATIVFLLTVFYDLIFAVGAGITLAAILFAKRITEQTNVNIKEVTDDEILKLESEIEHDTHYKIRVIHIQGIFFFGSVSRIVSTMDNLFGTKFLILNFESIPLMDISAIFALEDIIYRLKGQDIKILMVVQCSELKAQLLDLGIVEQIGDDMIFDNEPDAIDKAKNTLQKITRTRRIKFFSKDF